MSRRSAGQSEPGKLNPEGLERRRFLGIALAIGGGAAAASIVASDPAAAKTSKAAAAYQSSPKGGRSCAGCRFFNAGSRTCQLVDDEISPSGWCKFYKAASSGY
jgi:hypothetical protein